LMITGRRRTGQTLRDHRRHMKDVHGALVLKNIAVDPGFAPHRYVQNHVFDSTFGPAPSPLSIARDFITEVWFPDPSVAKRSRESAFYNEHLKDDEDAMVDPPSVIGVPCVEELVSSRRPSPAGPVKVFVLVARAEDAAPERFDATRREALGAADLSAASHHVGNRPVAPGPVAWIDTFWLPDMDTAYGLGDAYATEVLGPLEKAGLTKRGLTNILLAHEHVLHIGEPQYDIRHSEELK
jgi:hypothetical protein